MKKSKIIIPLTISCIATMFFGGCGEKTNTEKLIYGINKNISKVENVISTTYIPKIEELRIDSLDSEEGSTTVSSIIFSDNPFNMSYLSPTSTDDDRRIIPFTINTNYTPRYTSLSTFGNVKLNAFYKKTDNLYSQMTDSYYARGRLCELNDNISYNLDDLKDSIEKIKFNKTAITSNQMSAYYDMQRNIESECNELSSDSNSLKDNVKELQDEKTNILLNIDGLNAKYTKVLNLIDTRITQLSNIKASTQAILDILDNNTETQNSNINSITNVETRIIRPHYIDLTNNNSNSDYIKEQYLKQTNNDKLISNDRKTNTNTTDRPTTNNRYTNTNTTRTNNRDMTNNRDLTNNRDMNNDRYTNTNTNTSNNRINNDNRYTNTNNRQTTNNDMNNNRTINDDRNVTTNNTRTNTNNRRTTNNTRTNNDRTINNDRYTNTNNTNTNTARTNNTNTNTARTNNRDIINDGDKKIKPLSCDISQKKTVPFQNPSKFDKTKRQYS